MPDNLDPQTEQDKQDQKALLKELEDLMKDEELGAAATLSLQSQIDYLTFIAGKVNPSPTILDGFATEQEMNDYVATFQPQAFREVNNLVDLWNKPNHILQQSILDLENAIRVQGYKDAYTFANPQFVANQEPEIVALMQAMYDVATE